jgi:hypothetical protein
MTNKHAAGTFWARYVVPRTRCVADVILAAKNHTQFWALLGVSNPLVHMLLAVEVDNHHIMYCVL